MRSEFLGYFRLSTLEMNRIQKEALLVLDANVLLNLYRSSDEARSDFLALIEEYKERVWLPHQVVFEFLENRPKVIIDQARLLEEFKGKIKESLDALASPKSHPFVRSETLKSLSSAIDRVCGEIDDGRSKMEQRLGSDDILETLADLTAEKVGERFSDDDFAKIFREGEERYKQKIPPGYCDDGKGADSSFSSQRRRFGDYVLWRELLRHSAALERDVIFVTADEKEDWWSRQSGRRLGPRPELIEEFFRETKRHIILYTAQRFLQKFGRSTAEVIQEVGQLGRSATNSNLSPPESQISAVKEDPFDSGVSSMMDEMIRLRFKAAMVRNEIQRLKTELVRVKRDDAASVDHIAALQSRLKLLSSRYDDLKRSISLIDSLTISD